MLQQGLHIRACQADQRQAEENIRRHPGPVVVPAIQYGQYQSEPDPAERDSLGLRVAQQEEECRGCEATDDAPPLVVLDKEITEMVDRNQYDRNSFQPVGVVNGPVSGHGIDVGALHQSDE